MRDTLVLNQRDPKASAIVLTRLGIRFGGHPDLAEVLTMLGLAAPVPRPPAVLPKLNRRCPHCAFFTAANRRNVTGALGTHMRNAHPVTS